MAYGAWNRSSRRSGGNRPVRLVVPRLTADEARVMVQREHIRAEFGEEGVRRFDAAMHEALQPEREKEVGHVPVATTARRH